MNAVFDELSDPILAHIPYLAGTGSHSNPGDTIGQESATIITYSTQFGHLYAAHLT